ncbi:MAG: response regulator [Elusimicrobia bacterium]|nr:response regulator [Elusimicrobiota bacterium]
MREKIYSTFEAAKMMGLSPGTVANWVDSGKLKAFTTLGGHRRIKAEDFRNFLIENRMPVPKELESSVSSPKKVLMVEDDPKFLRLMEKFFRAAKKDWELFFAADGFQAGSLVGSEKPDVVILDIMLPDINGFKVCEIIKASDKRTLVIAVTGYDSEDIKNKILAAGADDYYVKPFKFEALIKRIDEWKGRGS